MTRRKCASCGQEKDVYGGKTCEKDHFICKAHAYNRTTCPLDGTRLK